MFKQFLLVSITLLICSSQVYADDSSHRQACEELLRMLDVDKMLNAMFERVNKTREEMMEKINVPENMKETSKRYMKKIDDLVLKELSWDSIKKDFIDIYTEVFTEPEIREMINFYNSPLGKKFVEKSPLLMQKVIGMSQDKVIRIMPEIQKLSKEMAQEIEQKKRLQK